MAEEEGIRGKQLAQINHAQKHQEAHIPSDITSANEQRIRNTCLKDWRDSFEGNLGKYRSTLLFGKEYPMTTDWNEWNMC